jgi:hypothetical protein
MIPRLIYPHFPKDIFRPIRLEPADDETKEWTRILGRGQYLCDFEIGGSSTIPWRTPQATPYDAALDNRESIRGHIPDAAIIEYEFVPFPVRNLGKRFIAHPLSLEEQRYFRLAFEKSLDTRLRNFAASNRSVYEVQ